MLIPALLITAVGVLRSTAESNEKECGVVKHSKPATGHHGQFPWHVGLYQQLSDDSIDLLCGGTIISPQHVVTAAHCLQNDNTAGKLRIAAGNKYRIWNHTEEEFAQFINVKEVIIPERYLGTENRFTSDIAVLKLAEPLKFSDFVQPACFSSETKPLNQVAEGQIAGWGLLSQDGKTNEGIKAMVATVVPFQECMKEVPTSFVPFLTLDKTCAQFRQDPVLCLGDTGGGLVFQTNGRYTLNGVASVASESGCKMESIFTFTQVDVHRQWINEILDQ